MLKKRIHIEQTELVYRDEELSFSVDGSCCTLRHPDGSIEFFTTDLGELPYYRRFRGTAEHPFMEELEPFQWDYNGYKSEWPCGLWVQSFYRCEDGLLIGFVHREDLNNTDWDYKQNYHIGFGVSHDGGAHWKYLGDVCGTVCNYLSKNETGGKYPNIGGIPFVEGKDGYFYFYFNEYTKDYERYVSGARVPMKEAIEMIRRDELPAALVKKYSGDGIWDTDPISGTAARMLPENCPDIQFVEEVGYKYDCHSDAAYCSALDRYVLAVQTARQLILFFSEDGAHWEEHVVASTAEPYTGMYYYSTIVGLDQEASDDFSTVGHDFYIYFTHKPGFLRLPGNYGDYSTDLYCRCRVTVTEE